MIKKKIGHNLLIMLNVQEATRNHLRAPEITYDGTTKNPQRYQDWRVANFPIQGIHSRSETGA